MLRIENLLSSKDHIDETADLLKPEDIDYLVELLSVKNNDIRYAALLMLESRSSRYADVYGYWDIFVEKLSDENSFQRSIGMMMTASNIKWDKENRFDKIAKKYLSLCEDEKFITARQTIQNIEKWIDLKPELQSLTVDVLIKIDIAKQKDTQKKLLLMDILRVLSKINNPALHEIALTYAEKSLKSGILDKKSAKETALLYDIN